MHLENKNIPKYRILKTIRGSKPTFVDMADSAALEAFRDRHSKLDLFISTWSLQAPDPSAQRNYDLRFHITAPDVETVRVSALEADQYIEENFGIPDDCMEITYDGGGIIGNNTASEDDVSSEETGETTHIISRTTKLCDHNNADAGIRAGDNDDIGQNADNTSLTDVVNRHGPASSSSNSGRHRNNGNAKDETTAAKIIISIPPVVFGGQSTLLMPALNYHLARQIAADSIQNIDIDVYQRDQLIPLPNSINSTTGRFVIPLTMKDLLYLDGNGIAELARKHKSESLIMSRPVPEAVEWYAETRAEFKNKQCWQDNLRKTVWDNGCEVPPCIHHIMRLCLYDHNRLEAYRIISSFFAWIKAGPGENRHLIYTINRRNPIKNHRKMNAIITFADENPWFVGCEHPLLHQFCPAGKCFMAELIEDYEKPQLFEQA